VGFSQKSTVLFVGAICDRPRKYSEFAGSLDENETSPAGQYGGLSLREIYGDAQSAILAVGTAVLGCPLKRYEFAGSFNINETFSAGRPMVTPTFSEAIARLSFKLHTYSFRCYKALHS